MIRLIVFLGNRGAVDLGEVRRDLAGGQAFGVQRQHHLIDAGQPALALLDDLRLKRRGPIPWHIELDGPVVSVSTSWPGCRCEYCPARAGRVMLVIAQVLGHLLVERGLEHRLGQLLE